MNRCQRFADDAAELILGGLGGHARAAALFHVETCSECRRVLEDLARVADKLLLLAPLADPPAGFETRVIGRLVSMRR